MTFDVGEVQAAIWRTEEAIDLQRFRLASETDRILRDLAERSLASLEDLLGIQRRTLEMLLGQTDPASLSARLRLGHSATS